METGQFSFQFQRKATLKNVQTTLTIALISHVSKAMLKILQARLQQYVNQEIKLPTSIRSSKKQEDSRRISTSASLTTPKPLTVWIKTNWKILQEMEYQTSWEIYMQVNKPQLELDMQQQSGSK